MVNGRWSVVVGRWSVVVGRWSVVVGRWSVVVGRWSVVVGRWSLVLAWAVAIALGALQASVAPYRMSSEDIVSYLDIADGFLQRRWDVVVNGYWSPLYPAMLAIGKAVTRASRVAEFPLVRGVNFVMYLGALAAFEYFLRELIASRTSNPQSPAPNPLLRAAGYALFLWSSLVLIGLRSDTPDLASAAFVYVAAGLLVRAQRDQWTIGRAALLGGAVAFAYHGKAAMFPIALLFIALVSTGAGTMRARALRTIAAFAVFAVVAGPFVATLSAQKHRMTFGDSGRMNYVWLVNPGDYVVPGLHWQGGPPGFGTPVHPTRAIWPRPEAYEFNHPFGTFPPWSDPSYWYDGLQVRFSLAAQLRAIAANAPVFWHIFGWPLLALVIVAVIAGRPAASAKVLAAEHWRLVLVAVAMLGLYLVATNMTLSNVPPLQPSSRYIAPGIVLLFCAALSSIQVRSTPAARTFVGGAAIATAIVAAVVLGAGAVADVQALREPYREEELPHVAAMLREAGLRSGDKVGILGRKGDHEFWARMTDVQIVTQMPDGDAYFRTDERWRSEIRSALAATGASMLVYRRWFPVTITPEWRQLGDTQYWICDLHR